MNRGTISESWNIRNETILNVEEKWIRINFGKNCRWKQNNILKVKMLKQMLIKVNKTLKRGTGDNNNGVQVNMYANEEH